MVGIVIISHSQTLAEGVLELVNQMTQGEVPVAIAGGITVPGEDKPVLGTDPMKIFEAIQAVDQSDGVLLLMDMGSALMNAEMAVELLDEAVQSRVMLCEAPLVEGAVAAAVQAKIGGTLADVAAEARGALRAKTAHLRPAPTEDSAPKLQAPERKSAGTAITLALTNELGLHARPAAKFVAIAAEYQSDLMVALVKNGKDEMGEWVNGKSLNLLLALGGRKGDSLQIRATGSDAIVALEALRQFAESNFGDPPDSLVDSLVDSLIEEGKLPTRSQNGQNGVGLKDGLFGLPASPGVAVGPIFILEKEQIIVAEEKIPADNIEQESQRLDGAIAAGVGELQKLVEATKGEAADIISTQIAFAQDPDLLEHAKSLISKQRFSGAYAWQKATGEAAEAIAAVDDPYLQQRASDIRDMGYQILRHLVDKTDSSTAKSGSDQLATLSRPVILVADELHPSDTAAINPETVLGILALKGTATSHSAILARSLGIPAVVGFGLTSVGGIKKGDQLANFRDYAKTDQLGLDGGSGQVWLAPDLDEIKRLIAQRKQWEMEKARQKAGSQAEARTKDGMRIEVVANIRNPADAARALTFGAEGVGLFRIEFLFMESDHAPTEEEQYTAYCTAAENLDAKPLTIRTLDVGGDKPIDYIDIPPEENPFLGWRGIRYCLDKPEFFKTQLRAICRASADHPISIMFPMISTLDELLRAKAYLEEAQVELKNEGIWFDPNMRVGMMIEVPAAVFIADRLAHHVDFFSIGTNDLTQYTMAADRGNFQVSKLSIPLQPSVLRAIVQVAYAAHMANIPLAMCGEMAGNPLAIPLLLGLGVTEFSMSAPAIPKAKAVIANISMSNVQQ
ncbi:MAG: phosphoenolpyruvate-protein phosphotransferase/dihydroxyacetone kinase phosphotransfer subunit, partial [Cellvibrionaceae bacterium]